MLAIANNVTTRNAKGNREFGRLKTQGATSKFLPATILQGMAKQCVMAGNETIYSDSDVELLASR